MEEEHENQLNQRAGKRSNCAGLPVCLTVTSLQRVARDVFYGGQRKARLTKEAYCNPGDALRPLHRSTGNFRARVFQA